MQQILEWMQAVASGTLTPAEAAARIQSAFERNLGFARLDVDRPRRCGVPEVVFAPGKRIEHIVEIAGALLAEGQNVLITRAGPEVFEAVRERYPAAVYHAEARCVTADAQPSPPLSGLVVVVSAGTADGAVAEEAALTAERMGARVERVRDVGVAGLHRLLSHIERLRAARAIVVVAGMEGALPSVVAGLVSRPVIAVPTSVGYGASFQGVAALLAMLNSCVPGVTVVNIDNGFGAGVAAALINRLGESA
jgi:hypothetical protein